MTYAILRVENGLDTASVAVYDFWIWYCRSSLISKREVEVVSLPVR